MSLGMKHVIMANHMISLIINLTTDPWFGEPGYPLIYIHINIGWSIS